MEIYNEKVNDLLDNGRFDLAVTDIRGDVDVVNLSRHYANSTREVIELLQHGEQ